MAKLTLKVKKVKFKNQQTKTDGYISRVISNGVVDMEDLCKEVAHNTTYNRGEVTGVAMNVLDVVADALKQGKIVELGELGRLYPSISSKWTEKEEDQTLANIETHVNFRPSQDVKAAIAGAKLAWASEKEAADADENGTTTDSGSTSDTGSTSGSDTGSGSSSGSDTGSGSGSDSGSGSEVIEGS